MNAKQLERRLAVMGVNRSAFDVVVRRLREAFKVSTAGRGLNAHDLTIDETAWIVAAYAGSETAARADETLARLIDLRFVGNAFDLPLSDDFLVTMQLILRDHELAYEVAEIRIARNLPIAFVHYKDGRVHKFVSPEHQEHGEKYGNAMFRSEGVLSAGFLHQLAIDLSGVNDAAEALS